MKKDTYDTIIIGGGPAGLAAGLYAQRARMKTALIERAMAGGQVLLTELIENYPGFPGGIAGGELMEKMEKQARGIGLEIIKDEIAGLKTGEGAGGNRVFYLRGQAGLEYKALSVIIATGAHWRRLGVPGEDKFTGRGVSYCATCDGPFFKDKKVVVVGGGDKAVEEAIFLTKFASEVILIHRRNRLRAVSILQEALKNQGKVKLRMESVVSSIEGENAVRAVKIRGVSGGPEKEIACQGVFIFIGIDPNTGFVKDKIKLDEKGYIITDNEMASSLEGAFACGDVRKKTLQQIIVAAGEGAQAAMNAYRYTDKLKGTAYI